MADRPGGGAQVRQRGPAIADRIGDDRSRAANLNAIGVVHYLRGEYDAAQPLLERAVVLNEATGNLKEAGRVAANLGHLHAAQNRDDDALAA